MSGIFGGGSQPALPAPTPVQEAPPPTPMVDEALIAKKKKQALARRQTGRSSTVLASANDDTLGV